MQSNVHLLTSSSYGNAGVLSCILGHKSHLLTYGKGQWTLHERAKGRKCPHQTPVAVRFEPVSYGAAGGGEAEGRQRGGVGTKSLMKV